MRLAFFLWEIKSTINLIIDYMLQNIASIIIATATTLSPVNNSNPQFNRADNNLQCGWTMTLALPESQPGEVMFYGMIQNQACVADEAHFVGVTLLGSHISGEVTYEGSRGYTMRFRGDGISGVSRDNETFRHAWNTVPDSILQARAIEISAWVERSPYPEW